ncbi:MAG TPA: hypothetical protein PKC03_16600, partial [Dokdonella sp.]|nr:hypothetical protein [Dokdonella sp.]
MLRLTEIKLPLDHAEQALVAAIRARLGLRDGELVAYTIFRRGVDARKKSAIAFIYTLDVSTTRDAELLKIHAADPHVVATPDTAYRFVDSGEPVPARRADTALMRPVVIGTGPCGILAALILAQMGLRPL